MGEAVVFSRVIAGDLVFSTGGRNLYVDDPDFGVGHVGVATGEGSVIHAANTRQGVIESPIESFLCPGTDRGARRYIPAERIVLTLQTPAYRCVETDDDVYWIVLPSVYAMV